MIILENNEKIKENEKTTYLFEKQVLNLLSKFLINNETIEQDYSRNNMRFDFFTKDGIMKLNIKSNTAIECKFYSSDKLAYTLKQQLEKYQTKDLNLLIITNLSNESLAKLNITRFKNVEIWPINKLVAFESSLNGRDDIAYKVQREPVYKNLNIDYLDQYLYFLIRRSIIYSYFGNRNLKISSLSIIGKRDNSIWEFDFQINNKLYCFKYNNVKNEEKLKSNDTMIVVYYNVSSINNISNGFIIYFQDIGAKDCVINSEDFINYLPSFIEPLGDSTQSNLFIYKYKKLFDSFTPLSCTKFTMDTILNNDVYFSTKDKVNDPFDLDIRQPTNTLGKIDNKNMQSARDPNVALFCVTRDPRNILMWSHYGDSHKGICFQYNEGELMAAINNDSNITACFYGDVEYNPKRPRFKNIENSGKYLPLTISSAVFNIICLFTKYLDWQYEKEKRYIIFSNRIPFSNGYIIHIQYHYTYFGARLSTADINAVSPKLRCYNYSHLSLDNNDYKLN